MLGSSCKWECKNSQSTSKNDNFFSFFFHISHERCQANPAVRRVGFFLLRVTGAKVLSQGNRWLQSHSGLTTVSLWHNKPECFSSPTEWVIVKSVVFRPTEAWLQQPKHSEVAWTNHIKFHSVSWIPVKSQYLFSTKAMCFLIHNVHSTEYNSWTFSFPKLCTCFVCGMQFFWNSECKLGSSSLSPVFGK